jgi:hypothetical protein
MIILYLNNMPGQRIRIVKKFMKGILSRVGGDQFETMGKVIFGYGAFMLTNIYGRNFTDSYRSFIYVEVVGNIHENPELFV